VHFVFVMKQIEMIKTHHHQHCICTNIASKHNTRCSRLAVTIIHLRRQTSHAC
jgi:hypothetical protein